MFLYEKGNYSKQLRGMLQDDWETKFVNLDAESWELFICRLEQAEHECIPKKKSTQSRKYKPLWMNEKTLEET